MADQLVSLIFQANLSFSALLLAVMGILISLYVKAEHLKWKRRFRFTLVFCGGAFFVGIIKCLLSLFYIMGYFSSISVSMSNLIIALFVGELTVLGFAGVLLVMILVVK